jgi:molybdopterin/thiamine biosynthesis adenylyltransferase
VVTIFQVGVGSGGIVVLDAIAADSRISHVSLLDPDVYQEHNVERHRFDRAGVGKLKTELAMSSFRARLPDLQLDSKPWDLCDPTHQADIEAMVQQCDVGICAADNETAKYHFDTLMRRFGKPWTLGEVLSGGIGGFVHRFVPGGPCYGCVASYLKRNVNEAPVSKPPDYSLPGGPIEETRIPASKAAIETIAGLHALVTLELLSFREGQAPAEPAPQERRPPHQDTDFTSLLFSMKKVEGVFAEAFRSHRFRVPKLESCLMCGSAADLSPENLDVALDQAFARLGDS